MGKTTYADKLSDPGGYAFITCKNRWTPTGMFGGGPHLTINHTHKGVYSEGVPSGIMYNPTGEASEFPTAGTPVAYLDGSVQFVKLRDAKARRISLGDNGKMQTGEQDFLFF